MTAVAAIEWTWTVLSAFGVCVCAWALVDSYLDRREQKAKKINGLSTMIVRMNLRTAQASSVLHTFFLALGVFALRADDPEFTMAYLVFGGTYILVAATNVRALLLNQIDRVLVRRRARAAGRH